MDNSGINISDLPELKYLDSDGFYHVNLNGKDFKFSHESLMNALGLPVKYFGSQINQLTSISQILTDQSKKQTPFFKYGSVMIGSIIAWPSSKMPQEIWPDIGMTFIPYNNQNFDLNTYPLLGSIFTNGKLPVDTTIISSPLTHIIRAA